MPADISSFYRDSGSVFQSMGVRTTGDISERAVGAKIYVGTGDPVGMGVPNYVEI